MTKSDHQPGTGPSATPSSEFARSTGFTNSTESTPSTEFARSTEFDKCVGLFESELDYIYQSLRRQGLADADAEDVVQEVFLIMWRRWSDYDPRRPLRAWLAGMAFRVAYRHKGKLGREVPGGLFDVVAEQPTPEDLAFQSSSRALVQRALARLSERERLVLRAHDVEGVSVQDIAETLAIPLQTAYTRLRAGRRNLARLVRRMGIVAEARADMPAGLLRPGEDPPPVSPERRKRAVNRARALWPLLPLPADKSARLAPQSGPAPRTVFIELASVAAVVALFVLLTTRPSGPPATAVTGRDHKSTSAAADPFRPIDERSGNDRPNFLAVAPATVASHLPDAAPADAAPATLHHGLIGYWRFDDGQGSPVARDASGNGNDCLLRGLNPAAQWTVGPIGGAIELTGRGWLECPRVETLAGLSNQMTVALWMKRTGVKDHNRALVTRQYGQDGRDHFNLGFRGEQLWLRNVVKGTAAGSRVKVQRGRWYHVAGTFAADGTARVYLDGEEVGNKHAAGRPSLGGGSNPMLIGAGYNGPDTRISERLQGYLDEMLIYDRALSPDEIRALASRVQPWADGNRTAAAR